LLAVLADEGRPMSLRDIEADGRLTPPDAVRQLSVARVAGFVRPTAGRSAGVLEPCYQPTVLGMQIARRLRIAAGRSRVTRPAPGDELPEPPLAA
jgi:hypothetical protein